MMVVDMYLFSLMHMHSHKTSPLFPVLPFISLFTSIRAWVHVKSVRHSVSTVVCVCIQLHFLNPYSDQSGLDISVLTCSHHQWLAVVCLLACIYHQSLLESNFIQNIRQFYRKSRGEHTHYRMMCVVRAIKIIFGEWESIVFLMMEEKMWIIKVGITQAHCGGKNWLTFSNSEVKSCTVF